MPRACGPSFPNNLLEEGDQAVLVAPVTDFEAELDRMNLATSRFHALPPEGNDRRAGYAAQASSSEANDLAAALKKAKVPEEERQTARKAHAQAREKLRKYLAEVDAWESSRPWTYDDQGSHRGEPEIPKPAFPSIEISPALPREFKLYLEGAVAWNTGGKDAARESWEALLNLPPAERHWKSTWASFMLGKSFEKLEPEKAITWFRQVRDLARHGFADSTGLAAASLGLEARVCLSQQNYNAAIELYLEQLASGDGTASGSLRITAAAALQNGSSGLQTLAANPRPQKVITAYLISSRWRDYSGGEKGAATSAWLEAIEASDTKDVSAADQLALAAYQTGDMESAQRWIQRAKHSPVADWLQAKLLLRSGKLEQATALLGNVCRAFPVINSNDTNAFTKEFQDNLSVNDNDFWPDSTPASRHALGELGVLHLARREYAQSLDALLRSGFWGDAAYVAERVLSIDELKNYVDQNWPAVSEVQNAAEPKINAASPEPLAASVTSTPSLRKNIRYLLARRLMRSIRGDEARPYYPAEWLPQFDQLCQVLRTGWDTSVATNERAENLFAAAMIARTNGMELLATEVQPDWHIHDGGYEFGVTWEERQTNSVGANLLKATSQELQRAAQNNADPEQRFHYRYQAAFLGWEAAKFLPNNSDETARVLCTAGSWLKDRDANTADIFYKALVRRNRLTAVGAEADRRRWFPDIDESGNLQIGKADFHVGPNFADSDPNPTDGSPETLEAAVSDPSPVAAEAADPEPASTEIDQTQESDPSNADVATTQPPFGDEYTVEPGDTLTAIVRRYIEKGNPTSVEEIVNANPGLRPDLIVTGQRILVPILTSDGS